MCPLRIILVFLSVTLAGFFVLRNLNSSPILQDDHAITVESEPSNALPLSAKVCKTMEKGFWICVDMASGRYLWRNLASTTSSSSSSSSSSSPKWNLFAQ